MRGNTRLSMVAVVVGALVLVASCGGGSADRGEIDDSTTSTSSAAAAGGPSDPSAIQFRAVLAVAGVDPTVPCPVTDPEKLDPDRPALINECDGATAISTYHLGPALLDGGVIEGATATQGQSGRWEIEPILREGAAGIDRFNEVAAQCTSKSDECPTGDLAIVVNGEVVSAPTIDQAAFERDQIRISGTFTEQSAKALAAIFGGS